MYLSLSLSPNIQCFAYHLRLLLCPLALVILCLLLTNQTYYSTLKTKKKFHLKHDFKWLKLNTWNGWINQTPTSAKSLAAQAGRLFKKVFCTHHYWVLFERSWFLWPCRVPVIYTCTDARWGLPDTSTKPDHQCLEIMVNKP